MKKLMVAFSAVALCGAVFAEDITSANVVGYQTYTAHAGYNLYSPTFIGLSGNKKLDIQSIKIPNADGWGCEQIWVINEDGTAVTGDTYTYKSTAAGEDVDGWWDDTNDKFAELEITEGQGFYIYCDSDEKEFQVSGEVKIGKFTTTLHSSYNYTGNFCPVKLSIQDFKLLNSQGWGCEQIWEMNEDGTAVTGNTYTWMSEEAGEDKDGWKDDSTGEDATVEFEPGEGLFFYCDGEDVVIELPEVIPAPTK